MKLLPSKPAKDGLDFRRITAIYLLSIAVFAPILFAMGRIVWCACQGWCPWSFESPSSHNSQHLFDWYTPSHILHGVLFYWLLNFFFKDLSLSSKLLAAVFLEGGWEILENSPFIINRYRTATMAYDYYGDSILNSCADIFSCLAGFLFARRYGLVASIAMFLIFEIFTLYFIKDNLTLNVIMLIYPLDFIKSWQLGQ